MKKISIDEVVSYVDEQCPNQYSRENKISWLSELDEMLFENVIKDRENPEIISFDGYSSETDGSTSLLAPAMFKEMYRFFLEKSIAYSNREITAYNNASSMFEGYFESFYSWYNKNHKTAKTLSYTI